MAFYVFDLDGTLADCEHRKPLLVEKDWRGFFAAVGDDKPIERVLAVLRTLHEAGNQIEIWSGRSDECRAATEAWLARHGVPDGIPVIMRRAGDKRPDDMVKREFLRGTNAPDVIFDDRQRVVDMWRREGIVCFQVAAGDF
jgi:phosphoglycolate phosphatase-like HAD superfamily hydrolase